MRCAKTIKGEMPQEKCKKKMSAASTLASQAKHGKNYKAKHRRDKNNGSRYATDNRSLLTITEHTVDDAGDSTTLFLQSQFVKNLSSTVSIRKEKRRAVEQKYIKNGDYKALACDAPDAIKKGKPCLQIRCLRNQESLLNCSCASCRMQVCTLDYLKKRS